MFDICQMKSKQTKLSAKIVNKPNQKHLLIGPFGDLSLTLASLPPDISVVVTEN